MAKTDAVSGSQPVTPPPPPTPEPQALPADNTPPPPAPAPADKPEVDLDTLVGYSKLLLKNRAALDTDHNNILTRAEFDANKAAAAISAEDQAALAAIDATSFSSIASGDLNAQDAGISLNVVSANAFLVDQIKTYGNPLPTDYTLSALTAAGKIADPNNLTAAEKAAVDALNKNFAENGFAGLSADDQAIIEQAAANLLTVDASYQNTDLSTLTEEQLGQGIQTLHSRTRYAFGMESIPPVDPKNYDFQSLLGAGTQTDRYNLFLYNSVANQIKAETQGNLGLSDTVPTYYVPHKTQTTYPIAGSVGATSRGGAGTSFVNTQNVPINPDEQAFIDDWAAREGGITADNKDRLLTDLNAKFGQTGPGYAQNFSLEAVQDPWAGQRENQALLEQTETQAYRQWNADGTPTTYAPSHRAQQLAASTKSTFDAFNYGLQTLRDWGGIEAMESLSPGANADNSLGRLQALAALNPNDPAQWANLNVPKEGRQLVVDAARAMLDPKQSINLSTLLDDSNNFDRGDADSWLQSAIPGQIAEDPGDAAKQAFSGAVNTLSKLDGFPIMDFLELDNNPGGTTPDAGNSYVNASAGGGLGELANLAVDSPAWQQCADWNVADGHPERGAVPSVEERQALIDAAKLMGSPEQAGNLQTLLALEIKDGQPTGNFSAEMSKTWLDENPAKEPIDPWLDVLGNAGDDVYAGITVDRDTLGGAGGFFANLFSLGLAGLGHTLTNGPEYSATQDFVREQNTLFGRSNDVLDHAMDEAQAAWNDAKLTEGFLFAATLPLNFIGTGAVAGAAARAGATLASSLSRIAGPALGALVNGLAKGVAPLIQNVLDPFSLIDLARAAPATISKVASAVSSGLGKLFGDHAATNPALLDPVNNLIKRASEGAPTEELSALATQAKTNLQSLGTLTAEQQQVVDALTKLETQWQRADGAAARLARGDNQVRAPLPQNAGETTPRTPQGSPASYADENAMVTPTGKTPSGTPTTPVTPLGTQAPEIGSGALAAPGDDLLASIKAANRTELRRMANTQFADWDASQYRGLMNEAVADGDAATVERIFDFLLPEDQAPAIARQALTDNPGTRSDLLTTLIEHAFTRPDATDAAAWIAKIDNPEFSRAVVNLYRNRGWEGHFVTRGADGTRTLEIISSKPSVDIDLRTANLPPGTTLQLPESQLRNGQRVTVKVNDGVTVAPAGSPTAGPAQAKVTVEHYNAANPEQLSATGTLRPYRANPNELNLNGQALFDEGDKVWCRHLSVWMNDAMKAGKNGEQRLWQSFDDITTPEQLAARVPADAEARFSQLLTTAQENHLIATENFGTFFQQQAGTLAAGESRQFNIGTANHAMLAKISSKEKDGVMQYSLTVYDPNTTVSYGRALTTNIEDIASWKLDDFLKPGASRNYLGETGDALWLANTAPPTPGVPRTLDTSLLGDSTLAGVNLRLNEFFPTQLPDGLRGAAIFTPNGQSVITQLLGRGQEKLAQQSALSVINAFNRGAISADEFNAIMPAFDALVGDLPGKLVSALEKGDLDQFALLTDIADAGYRTGWIKDDLVHNFLIGTDANGIPLQYQILNNADPASLDEYLNWQINTLIADMKVGNLSKEEVANILTATDAEGNRWITAIEETRLEKVRPILGELMSGVEGMNVLPASEIKSLREELGLSADAAPTGNTPRKGNARPLPQQGTLSPTLTLNATLNDSQIGKVRWQDTDQTLGSISLDGKRVEVAKCDSGEVVIGESSAEVPGGFLATDRDGNGLTFLVKEATGAYQPALNRVPGPAGETRAWAVSDEYLSRVVTNPANPNLASITINDKTFKVARQADGQVVIGATDPLLPNYFVPIGADRSPYFGSGFKLETPVMPIRPLFTQPVQTPLGTLDAAQANALADEARAALDSASAKLDTVPAGNTSAELAQQQQAVQYVTTGKVAPASVAVTPNPAAFDDPTWIKNASNNYNNASPASKEAFQIYSLDGAPPINNALRQGKPGTRITPEMSDASLNRTAQDYVNNMQALMVDIPEGAQFTRYMGSANFSNPGDEATVNALTDFFRNAEPGTVIQDPAFLSTVRADARNTLPLQWLKNQEIQLNLTAGPGVKGFPSWTNINQALEECLFMPNQPFVINSVSQVNGKLVIDATLLPSPPAH